MKQKKKKGFKTIMMNYKIYEQEIYDDSPLLFLWELVTSSKRGLTSTGNISNLITFQVALSSQSFNEDGLFLFPHNLKSHKHHTALVL